MRPLRFSMFCAALCVAISATAVVAQTLPGRAPDVIDRIPAGTLGFAIVPDINGAAEHFERFLDQAGLAPLVAGQMPEGILATIKQAAVLGEGFNERGSAAVVMLDPQQYGIDLVEAMQGDEPPKELPWVAYIPASGVQELFGNYEITPAGKYQKVDLRMGSVFAVKQGAHVLMSPMSEALDATVGKSGAARELGAAQKQMFAKSDITMHLNMAVAGPLYNAILRRAGQETMMGPAEMMVGFYQDVINQMSAVTYSVSFAEAGLLIDERVAMQPDSSLGKMVAAMTPAESSLVDRLPGEKYVVAFGSTGSTQGAGPVDRGLQSLFESQVLQGLDEATRQRVEQVVTGLADQVTGMQMTIGRAPEGSGVVGSAVVLQVKDAAATRTLLADAADLVVPVVKQLSGPEAQGDVQGMSVNYNKGIATVQSASVDSIEISPPAGQGPSEREKTEMAKVLGTDKFELLVAQADDKTVVLTFGGAQPMMAQALTAAGNPQQSKLVGPGEQAALDLMPDTRIQVLMLSIPNLVDTYIKAGEAVTGEPMPMPMPQLQAKMPITMATTAEKSEMQVRMLVPAELIKELVGTYFSMMGGGPGGPGGSGGPPPEDEADF